MKIFVSFLLALPLVAVETQTWEHSSLTDFEKGTFTRVSISSEGRMTLAPTAKELFDANTSFLWTIARDSKGNIYTGGGALGGSKAKLFLIDPQGRVESFPAGGREVFLARYGLKSTETFYTRFGDWFPILCVGLSVLIGIRRI